MDILRALQQIQSEIEGISWNFGKNCEYVSIGGLHMGKKMKPFDELSFSDNYMFTTVLEDKRNLNIAKGIVELALGKKVKDIRIAGVEKHVQARYGGKITRFDVLLEGEDSYIDVEMQVRKLLNFPLRSRMYHSQMDAKYVKAGDYQNMKKSIVIFICLEDYFGMRLPRYTFASMCLECSELILEDKRFTIFLNPDSDTEDSQLYFFLMFLKKRIAKDAFTKTIEKAVATVKKDESARLDYMNLDEYLDALVDEEKAKSLKEGIEAGKAQGLEEGKAQGLQEGKAQGLEEGKAQGLQEGKAQGMQQSKIEIAKKMLSKGMSLDLVVEMTGLSEEEIKTL